MATQGVNKWRKGKRVFFIKKHMAMAVPALCSSNTERGSAARRLVQDQVRTSRWDSVLIYAQSCEPLAEKLHCVRVLVASQLFPVTIFIQMFVFFYAICFFRTKANLNIN